MALKNDGIENSILDFSNLSHTTNIESFTQMMQNMTLMFTSVDSPNLNDLHEKERKGIEHLAGLFFASCYSKLSHESVPFWCLYGNSKAEESKKNKLLLQFGDVHGTVCDFFDMNCATTPDGKMLFFDFKDDKLHFFSDKISIQGLIKSVQMKDVVYESIFSQNIQKIYKYRAEIVDGVNSVNVNVYDTRVLGEYKLDAWDFEMERRIITIVNASDDIGNRILFHLKPLYFKNMRVVLSPWDDGSLRDKVKQVINDSSLPNDIKYSIKIEDSYLKGTLNL